MERHQPIANGIAHGPYPSAPPELIETYLSTRYDRNISLFLSDEQLIKDIQSEWQYDQHCAAVEAAAEAKYISPELEIHFYEKVLRPWFIGRRNPGDKP